MTFGGISRKLSGRASECVALLVVVLLPGCAGREPHATVTGKVTLDNAVVSAGSVLFISDDGKAAGAELRADGTYSLECRPGHFKVAVTQPPPPDPLAKSSAPAPAVVNIPQAYQEVGSSGLATDVKEGANTFDIALSKSKKPA